MATLRRRTKVNLGGETEERRIMGRIAMPPDAARIFAKAINAAIREKGHRSYAGTRRARLTDGSRIKCIAKITNL